MTTRPLHPIISRIRSADKARREARLPYGLWSAPEAADLLETSVRTMHQLAFDGAIECYNVMTRGKKRRRFTSNGLIAFVTLNTTGPDEEQLCTNLEAVLKTLSLAALEAMSQCIAQRLHLVTGGAKPLPRVVRKLALPPPDEKQPELFAAAAK